MNRKNRKIQQGIIVALVLMSASIMGCKTGKGCDCPTFGKADTQKTYRF